MEEKCPCGSGQSGEKCCLPVIRNRSAETAEELMRSRYTAYVLCNTDYLKETWAVTTRPSKVDLDQRQKWLGLKIKETEEGGATDDKGVVEFIARYKVDGRGYRLHEISKFRRENGQWFYVSGLIKSS